MEEWKAINWLMSTILVNLREMLVVILWWFSKEELQSFSPNSCFQNVLPPLLPFDPLFFARENTRSVNESQPQAKGIAFKHSWLLEAKQVDLVRANTYSYKLMKLKARHTCFFKVG